MILPRTSVCDRKFWEKPTLTKTLTIDIGNTTTAWGLWNHSELTAASRVNHRDAHTRFPAEWFEADRIAVATVSQEAAEALTNRWHKDLAAFDLLSDFRDIPIATTVDHPEQVGVDRLLNALAWSRTHPGEAAIIIDFGTAITFDLVDRAGSYVGGLIIPGPELIAHSLDRNTSLLPRVAIEPDFAPFGTNTESAIIRGVSGVLVEGLNRQIARVRQALGGGNSVHVVSTGGGAATWTPYVTEIERVVPFLTLQGIWDVTELRAGDVA